MQLLITNDDGIDAPGLAALRAAAAVLGETTVVAPQRCWSSCGHGVTTHQPLEFHARSAGETSVAGTPADCVRLALAEIAPLADWTLAGINAGGNLGVDIHMSGTVAAARESAVHGKPAVAISHYIRREWPVDWERASRWTVGVLKLLFGRGWSPGTLWNVNLPHLEATAPDPEVVFCALETAPLPLNFRAEENLRHYTGNYRERRRSEGSDVAVCFGGAISVSRVSLW